MTWSYELALGWHRDSQQECEGLGRVLVLLLTHQGESIFKNDLQISSHVEPVHELKTEQHCLLLAFLSSVFAAKWGAFLAVRR